MSEVDSENGDVIENPDPEADASPVFDGDQPELETPEGDEAITTTESANVNSDPDGEAVLVNSDNQAELESPEDEEGGAGTVTQDIGDNTEDDASCGVSDDRPEFESPEDDVSVNSVDAGQNAEADRNTESGDGAANGISISGENVAGVSDGLVSCTGDGVESDHLVSDTGVDSSSQHIESDPIVYSNGQEGAAGGLHGEQDILAGPSPGTEPGCVDDEVGIPEDEIGSCNRLGLQQSDVDTASYEPECDQSTVTSGQVNSQYVHEVEMSADGESASRTDMESVGDKWDSEISESVCQSLDNLPSEVNTNVVVESERTVMADELTEPDLQLQKEIPERDSSVSDLGSVINITGREQCSQENDSQQSEHQPCSAGETLEIEPSDCTDSAGVLNNTEFEHSKRSSLVGGGDIITDDVDTVLGFGEKCEDQLSQDISKDGGPLLHSGTTTPHSSTDSDSVRSSIDQPSLTDQVKDSLSLTLLETSSDVSSSYKQSDETHSESQNSQGAANDEDLLSELDAELEETESSVSSVSVTPDKTPLDMLPNGLRPVHMLNLNELRKDLQETRQIVREQDLEIQRLQEEKEEQSRQMKTALKERDSYLREVKSLKSHNADDLYLPQIKEMEYTITKYEREVQAVKDKLSSHDAAAKRAVNTLQNELKLRVDQVTKMYEEANKEKDAMVVKYAQAEQRNIQVTRLAEKMEGQLKEALRDKENLLSRVRDLKGEKHKLGQDLEAKTSEISLAVKDIEKQKEQLSSADVRVKWAQNKLKAELEGHKETKVIVEKLHMKLKESREEAEQIRRDCQAIVKTYQESEEIKSNSLGQKLKEKQTECLLQQHEKSNTEEMHSILRRELEAIKVQHKEVLGKLTTVQEKNKSLENQVASSEDKVSQYQGTMQKQKQDSADMRSRIEKLVQEKGDFNRAQAMIRNLDTEIGQLKISNKDLVAEMEACGKRESEKLELTEKLSAKNAQLQSENINFNNKVSSLVSELQGTKMDLQQLETSVSFANEKLDAEQKGRKVEVESLTSRLAEKTKSVDELKVKVEEEKDENKTLKRKQVNSIKDLTRQLLQARRKLDTIEANGERDTISMGSRTSSNGSLNTAGLTAENHMVQVLPAANNTNSFPSSRHPSQEQEYPVITEQVEVDKQVLIERIVRLQRGHARKNEKIEFMDDHIHHLMDEIQRKNKIIQSYVLREESGTLTSEYMDHNKAQLARKHSIMASVYSSHSTDGAMTLDLSLEISKKIQAVLEDTILKNITLKESLDTLGQEISRLSQENRSLQLQVQSKTKDKH